MGIAASKRRTTDLQANLKSELVRNGVVDPGCHWTPLTGGRTNAIWRIGSGPEALVCKLFDRDAESPLFPNDPRAEYLALEALSGTGLAPQPVAFRYCEAGTSLLYRHVPGTPFRGAPTKVAKALELLHRQTPPTSFRRIESGPDAIRQNGFRILDGCKSTQAVFLRGSCPDVTHQQFAIEPVFLHGDVVPGNVIGFEGTLTFIDWQCPAVGDPAEDISVYLSPAMQSLYGGYPLSQAQEEDFLAAYGNAEVTCRYLVLRPLFHWRMAAHCLWKSERGAFEYEAAGQMELDRLKLA